MAFTLMVSSCIRQAPLNPEADIEVFELSNEDMTGKTVIDQVNRKIQLYLTHDAFNRGIAPVITVSAGAHITPASGDSIRPRDGAVVYTVVSQNGANSKQYTVELVNVGNWNFNFENWGLQAEDRYEFPLEADGVEIWTSGNPGVAFAGVAKEPDAYPTRSTTEAYSGSKSAELVTIKGTLLSEFVGAYIFSGSLFLGTFNASQALANPLKATEFGQPYIGLPKSFKGYYKYLPGPVFQDEHKNPVPGRTDECAVYAVLFEGPERLNATNIHTSDKVIAMAALTDGTAKANYTGFNIPFVFKNGKEVSSKNLMMAIVASSSKEGDYYRGAIGSRLLLDSLVIIPQ